MDKFLIRKDVYDEIVKAIRDRSHLVQKDITDKNGHKRKVWVRGNEQPKEQRAVKGEETTEETKGKPKFNAGDSVNLDGAKGDFKVQSIDKDGAYHVVSADGKKGYKVSENHITGKTEEKEIEFEKKNNASKSEEITRKNDAENNVKEAIKLTESEKNEIFKTLENPDFMSTLDKEQNSTTIGNIILNNLYSSGKEDLFNKIRKQEWDYKNANDKHGNTFNSDYAKEAMYQLYQEYKNNPKQTENKEPEKTKETRPKKEVSVQVKMKRKEQQKKEKEKYDYNKRMNDFYVNTGLDGGPEAVLYRQAVEKEENKQPNLRAGSRDDSIFEENDDVQFWRSGNYIDGKITQVKESYDGSVSLQVESNGNKYWVETENIIKHPASDSNKEKDKGNNKPVPENADGSIPADSFNANDYKKSFTDPKATNDAAGIAYIYESLGETGKEAEAQTIMRMEKLEKVMQKKGGTDIQYTVDTEHKVYTRERQELHEKIINEYLSPEKIASAKPKDGEKPKFIVFGGRGGSGKSWFTDSERKASNGWDVKFDPNKFITIDADAIKEFLIPPYEGWNAGEVHEESSYLKKIIQTKAKELGLNIIIDGTMSYSEKPNGSNKVKDEMIDFKNSGYSIEAHYMFVPVQESTKRAIMRFAHKNKEETSPDYGKYDYKGRLVPMHILLGMQDNEKTFDSVKEICDNWTFSDNQGKEPKLISKKEK